MPENQPPENDPFADLYGRLPDPRTGARADQTPPSRRAAREARRAATDAPATPTPAASTPGGERDDPADRSPRDAPPAGPPTAGEPSDAPSGRGTSADSPRSAAAAAASGASVIPSLPADSRAGAVPPGARRGGARTDADAAGPAREPVLVGAGAAAAGASSEPAPAASGSLEQLFTGQTTTHEIGYADPAPSGPRRHLGRWIALAVVLLLVGGIGGGTLALWNTYGARVQAFFGDEEPVDFEAGQATGEARVTIVSGDTGESVSPKLFEAGVTKASNSLYKYMVDNNVAFTFQPGVYKLQQQMTSEAVLAALRLPETRLDYSVQLREGLTLDQSLGLISEQLSIPRADLDAAVANPAQYGVAASTLEGWIFPATYDFDEGVSAQQVIDTMVKRTVQSLDAAGVPEADRERILIIASIIEREARNSDDFYRVSRVIENRLQPDNVETHGLLQMDSTAQYGANELDAGSSSSSENALTSDNPWNTYIRPGLPIGPIANAGDLAIDAAMHPVDGTWYYFTTVNLATGETVFSTTYDDQLKAVEQFRAWCRENPDGGC